MCRNCPLFTAQSIAIPLPKFLYLSGFSQENRTHTKYSKQREFNTGCRMHRRWFSEGDQRPCRAYELLGGAATVGAGGTLGSSGHQGEGAAAAAFGIMETTQYFSIIAKRRSKERKSVRDRGRTIASPFPLPSGLPQHLYGQASEEVSC